ncbi:MAG: N-6 DNA methylase [Roseivirga sp.]|uniref:type I restriction-modification system subunit M n=1 Tax=Roseivirga sp. TaxID=1964215 RepID=UPI001B2E8809|nr:type I restriction-modification system subunit M [Roseivirga sp.]MBO6660229.1 N-6 DNA methylase [Roseivirga sp.]MBO6907034.1 N-6 DNA methylase [Roseivirga sp.]
MLTQNIKSKVDALWDKFWSGGISNPLNAIEQITYLLFIKQLDENDTVDRLNSELTGEAYSSIFIGKYFPPGVDKSNPENGVDKEKLRWSKVDRDSENIIHTMQSQVFPFVKELGQEGSSFARHMQNAVFLIPKASLLTDAMDTIDEIYKEIKNEDRFIDTQGDVYEYLLSQLSQAGKNGQFRTPTHIIEMMVELVEPKLGEKIADPACGSSGFLLGSLKYIISEFTSRTYKKEDDNGFMRGTTADKLVKEADKKKLQTDTFYGFDIDPTMIRLGLMNLMMHGIKNPKIEYTDTLSKFYKEENFYQKILANPPFTGSVDKGELNPNFTISTTKSELLFLERIYKMLAIGGTAAVVVPQGVLFGSGKAFKELRKLIIENCDLKAVISMPSGVFKPYAGVATAILIFTKGAKTKNVWFYEMLSDGRSLDDKRTPLMLNGERDFGDLQKVVKAFQQRDPKKETDRKQQHFFVPKKEIEENGFELGHSKYKEEVYEEVVYEKPTEIFKKLEVLEKEIQKGIKEIKRIVQ